MISRGTYQAFTSLLTFQECNPSLVDTLQDQCYDSWHDGLVQPGHYCTRLLSPGESVARPTPTWQGSDATQEA